MSHQHEIVREMNAIRARINNAARYGYISNDQIKADMRRLGELMAAYRRGNDPNKNILKVMSAVMVTAGNLLTDNIRHRRAS